MWPIRRFCALTVLSLAFAVAAAGCRGALPAAGKGQLRAVGAESQYADVISQIGGRYVSVSAIQNNPKTDPHAFQASPTVAQLVGAAQIVVQNGLGYDTFMDKIEAASPDASRKVIDVQRLLGLPDSTANPHLWYAPTTMPALARALASALSALAPQHARYFQANLKRFDASLAPWLRALKSFARAHPGTAVATTEPVGNYMLRAAGVSILTPFSLQAEVMNGVDPSPQDVTLQRDLLARRRVKALLYNQQVTDALTESFIADARRAGVPVVGLYETLPRGGYDYQSWMLAEVRALERAVTHGISTERLT